MTCKDDVVIIDRQSDLVLWRRLSNLLIPLLFPSVHDGELVFFDLLKFHDFVEVFHVLVQIVLCDEYFFEVKFILEDFCDVLDLLYFDFVL